MNTRLMPESHQRAAPWAWRLEGRQVITLAAAPSARWLRVESGLVWITAREAGPAGEDLWLAQGQSLALPAGSAWLVEAWPSAQLSLLQVAPCAVSRAGAGWLGWRAWWAGPQAGPCSQHAA